MTTPSAPAVRASCRAFAVALDRAVGPSSLRNAEDQVAGDQRRRTLGEQIVHVRNLQSRELENIAEVLGGEQRQLQPLALQDGIDPHSRAVREVADRLGRDAVSPLRGFDALNHLSARLVGSRQDFQAPELLRVFIEQGKVGEGTADIDTNPVTHPYLRVSDAKQRRQPANAAHS